MHTLYNLYFRKLPLTRKIWGLFALLLAPLLLLLWSYHQAIEQKLAENDAFTDGFIQIQQLAQLQEQIAQFRGLLHGHQILSREQIKDLDHPLLLSTLHQNITATLDEIRLNSWITPHLPLFSTIDNFWKRYAPSPTVAIQQESFSTYSRLIQQVHQLMIQIAVTNTPHPYHQHPERLKIYSLATQTIPTLKEMTGQLRGTSYGALLLPAHPGNHTLLQQTLPTQLLDLQHQRLLVRDQLAEIYQHAPILYQESFHFFSDYSIESAALYESLRWEISQLLEGGNTLEQFTTPQHLFQQLSRQIESLDLLTNTLFTSVLRSLQQEQSTIQQQRFYRILLTALLIVLVGTLVHLTLSYRQRGAAELQQHFLQTVTPSSPPLTVDESLLDREQKRVWHAYRQMEQQLEHEAMSATESESRG